MNIKGRFYHWVLISMLFLCGCQQPNIPLLTPAGSNQVAILERANTNYRLQPFVQILTDTSTQYTIQEVTQSKFQSQFRVFADYPGELLNYRYYWGKVQLENRLPAAQMEREWVLSFSNTWTHLEVYTAEEDGSWKLDQNGTFTPDHLKGFSPTARGNLVKLSVPPGEGVTVYFRGISERAAIQPSFHVYVQPLEVFYAKLLDKKIKNAIFVGFLLMMFFYNLILYLFRRDPSFIFYAGYLIMMVIYAGYLSDDLVDWLGFALFPEHPAYMSFLKFSLFLGWMCYLAFIRSFLDLGQLLPKWDTFFKFLIYLGFALMAINLVVSYTSNFSYVWEDRISVPYIVLALSSCCALLYPLFKTKDVKGYFVISGITVLSLGALLTVLSRVWLTPFSISYLKAGTILEVLIFSLGLAYRQRKQKEAQQQAAFALRESQLIQEKKQLEAKRIQELSDFKARFYTNITHEFRTPLTVIMGMSDNLHNHPQEKKLIQRNSKKLLQLVKQLLDLSKVESGSLRLHQVHQDIIVYLQYLTESFYSAALQKDVRLVFHSEEDEVMMDFDEEKIQEIVYNLLSNALKFTPATGKIILHASTINQAAQPFLKLKVKDSGIGIAAEDLDAIFDRFYQVSHTQHSHTEGTGIGLALTKELVELMKGRIEVTSVVGKGTEFILYLPIEAKAAASQNAQGLKRAVSSTPIDLSDSDESPLNAIELAEESSASALPELLIIEDNQDIIAYIKSILKDSYRFHTAKNGALGIEMALEVIPDIIISDVMMPVKTGYEVCEVLKQDERTSHIPIILLTAKSTQQDKVEGLAHGADAYLSKPFDKKELLIRLKTLVEMRQQLQRRYASTSTVDVEVESGMLSLEDAFIQKLHEHIHAQLGNTDFGVTQLAAASDLSQMQLYRKLKALTGKTPSQFIRSYRLQQGLARLKEGKLNVSEVAYDVGFSDPSYFSRSFQKEFGKNPSDFLTR